MLKTDWIAVLIATVGVGVVTYHGWHSRNADPIMKKIVYGLLGLISLLWIMLVFMMLGGVSGL